MKKRYEKYDFDDLDKKVVDVDEIMGTDLKINPDYYIHTALLSAQKALLKENVNEGFLAYWVFVEHIEVLCRAAGMVGEDYDDNIKEYKIEIDFDKEVKTSQSLVVQVKLANKKLQLMMASVFSAKTITAPMQL